jgi:hypothetical protein
MTGYRAFSYDFVKTFPVLSKGFEIETEMTIHAISMNMAVENVIIQYRDRPEGSESKLNTVKDGCKVLKTIFNLCKNFKPLFFFSLLSLLMVLTATGMSIPLVIIPYFQTGLCERFPTLIVSCFLILAATISFFSGLILDTLKQKERRDFEFRLITLKAISSRNKND